MLYENIPKSFSTYMNSKYKVNFLYPCLWRKVNELRYEGIDGFFQISAISIDADFIRICEKEAYHKLKPYGSNPLFQRLEINEQEAFFIFPSDDQPSEMKEQSALIIKYPESITIGANTFNYFILWSNKRHIKNIAETLILDFYI